MNKPRVSIIIPSLNEEKTIGSCIQKALLSLKNEDIDGEIIVSDSSSDNSRAIAISMGAKVVLPVNKGYGNAYFEGIRYAKGDLFLFTDADDTYDLSEMPKFLEPLISGKADFVMGTRIKGDIKKNAMPWLHRYVGNPILTTILNMLFKTYLSDAHCGMRAITKKGYEKLDMKSEGMEYASEMIIEAARKKLRITEVPISYYPRQTPSKLHSWGDGWRHLRFMMLYNPTPFLFIPGLFVFCLGVFMTAALSMRGNVETTSLHSFILGSMLAIIGIQMIATGGYLKIYGIIHNKIDRTGITAQMLDYHSLEMGLLLGLILVAGGIISGAGVIYTWVSSGYGSLSEVGNAVIAMVLAAIGIQIIFSTLIISIFLLDSKDSI
ncbi:MAG: glycosyltransferase family 2 protein [Candidatus Methanoperedens sp.]|nr:glycosyltransferase family 2 protein [Candidatus Methanoperedens sp.]